MLPPLSLDLKIGCLSPRYINALSALMLRSTDEVMESSEFRSVIHRRSLLPTEALGYTVELTLTAS